MTTKEFILELEKLGLNALKTRDGESLLVELDDRPLIEIDNHTERCLDTNYMGFKVLEECLQEELYSLAVEYASTPIEEREEVEKYYWGIKFDNYLASVKYLNVNFDNKWIVSDAREDNRFKTKFTEKEYKKLVEDNFIPDIFEKEDII